MTIVRANHTLHAHGTLSAGSYFTVQGGANGTSGGVLILNGTPQNDGFVSIAGGNGAAGAGASVTLLPTGVLTNTGDIIIGFGGGTAANPVGPTIQIQGKLLNENLIRFGEGYGGLPATMTVASTGTLVNDGVFYLTGGRPGSTTGLTPGATLVDAGVLTNTGDLEFFGGFNDKSTAGQGALLSVTSTGVLTNTGLINLVGAYGSNSPGNTGAGTSGTLLVSGGFANSGTIQIGAAHTYGFGAAATGSALIFDTRFPYPNLVNTGLIAIAGGAGINGNLAPAGRLSVANNALFTSGTIDVAGGTGGAAGALLSTGRFAGLYGAGVIDVGGGSTGGAGGTLDLSGYNAFSTGVFDPGAPTLITLEAGISGGSGGVLIDQGRLTFDPAGVLSIAGGAGVTTASATLTSGAILYNSGTITGAGLLLNQGAIYGGTFDSANPGVIAVGNFFNDGRIIAGGFPVYGSAISILDGIHTDAGHTGLLSLVSNTITLYGTVDAGQTVQFNGALSQDTLALGTAPLFDGTLANFGSLATIDFLNLTVTAATASADTLTLISTTEGAFSIALSAPLDPTLHLTLTADGAGGTSLTLT